MVGICLFIMILFIGLPISIIVDKIQARQKEIQLHRDWPSLFPPPKTKNKKVAITPEGEAILNNYYSKIAKHRALLETEIVDIVKEEYLQPGDYVLYGSTMSAGNNNQYFGENIIWQVLKTGNKIVSNLDGNRASRDVTTEHIQNPHMQYVLIKNIETGQIKTIGMRIPDKCSKAGNKIISGREWILQKENKLNSIIKREVGSDFKYQSYQGARWLSQFLPAEYCVPKDKPPVGENTAYKIFLF